MMRAQLSLVQRFRDEISIQKGLGKRLCLFMLMVDECCVQGLVC